MALNEIRGDAQIKDNSIPANKIKSDFFQSILKSTEFTGDGTTKVFDLTVVSSNTIETDSVVVVVRGLRKSKSEFSVDYNAKTVTLVDAPETDDSVFIDWRVLP